MKPTFMNISQDKRQSIIDMSIRTFARYGYERTSTNHLVKELSISKGSLFKYFESKSDLYHYLVLYVLSELKSHMDTLKTASDVLRVNLLHYAEHEYDYLCAHRDAYLFFHKLLGELTHPDLETIRDELMKEAQDYQSKIIDHLMPDKAFGNRHDEEAYLLLMQHVFFIVQGYNEHFMKQVSAYEEFRKYKTDYLNGLNKHFDLVRW